MTNCKALAAIPIPKPTPSKPMKRLAITMQTCLLGLFAAFSLQACAQTGTDAKPVGESPAAQATAKAMGQGINLGNMLETPLAKGEWGVPADAATDFQRYVDLAADAGFTHVRMPVRWSSHASTDAAGTLDPAFAARVDAMVDRALARGLYVVLNMHHYRQLEGGKLDQGEPSLNDDVVVPRFLAMWRQIAQRYAGKSDKLLFEVYNEPSGKLNSTWNSLFANALKEIRSSNPTRIVVVGPVKWNNPEALDGLELPPDPNLLVTVHSYDPFAFTHQGADWVSPRLPTGVECCDDAQESRLLRGFEAVDRWRVDHKYSVYLGEFGAYSVAPEASRITYMKMVREAAQARGMPWAYWELASGFGVYDPVANTWRKPLLEALLPPKK
jgi:endoglucanase